MKATLVTLAAVALAAAPPADAAGTGSIEGTVVDQLSGQVVPGGKITVSVVCGSLRRGAAVDDVGHFAIGGLPEGACTLSVNGAAYVGAAIAVTVSAASIATVLVNVMTRAYMDNLRKQQEARMKGMKKHQRPRDLDRVGGARGAGGIAPAEVIDLQGRAPIIPQAPQAAPPPPMAALAPGPMPAPPPKKPQVKPAAPVATVPATPPPAQGMKAKADAVAAPAAAAKDAREEKAANVRFDDAKRVQLRQNKLAAGRAMGVMGAMGAMADVAPQVNGWAPVRVFPVPQYTRVYDGPRTDFRETVYWNPAVETSAAGDAEVAFVTSDAVTAFRATAEGFSAAGVAGGGTATFQSKLPLTVDAHLPVEVTSGDVVRLPITFTNETDEPVDAQLAAQFGAAFKLDGKPAPAAIHLGPRDKQSLVFALSVVAADGNADVDIKLTARGLSDQLKRTIRVVPRGFPVEASASGTARGGQPARHVLDLAGALPGSIHASVTMYPSPVAAMAKGMEGMIREPGGCFEQTSSTNYPNIMILGYLNSTSDAAGADPALVQKTQSVLDRGYKLLTGYETSDKGYEWFGHSPGHEALTAYGLMEFADMAKVYDVDRKMVDRTADWLMSRRDQQGGFQRSAQALDSFGRAGPATTNAYIMWALAEARRTAALGKELAVQKTLGAETSDPYLLALAANTNLAAAPKTADSAAMAKRLAAMQSRDGSFPGAKETITMSGGESLVIETTSLAVLALLKASPNSEYESQIRAGVDWLNSKRGGYGAWGNTQATILGLKALTAYTEHARQMSAPGSATLVVNGKDAGTISFDKGRRDALVWSDVAGKLVPGENTIELRLDGQAQLPYSIAIEYRSAQPRSSPRSKIAVTTQLLKTQARMGEGVTLRAHVENTTASGVPMTLARVGLPGGTVFQTWQLKELRDKGLIDFYETRPREVILYWRALAPSAKKDVDLNLLAAVPGSYEAPASSAYLYYTAEDKAWTKPVAITIDR